MPHYWRRRCATSSMSLQPFVRHLDMLRGNLPNCRTFLLSIIFFYQWQVQVLHALLRYRIFPRRTTGRLRKSGKRHSSTATLSAATLTSLVTRLTTFLALLQPYQAQLSHTTRFRSYSTPNHTTRRTIPSEVVDRPVTVCLASQSPATSTWTHPTGSPRPSEAFTGYAALHVHQGIHF